MCSVSRVLARMKSRRAHENVHVEAAAAQAQDRRHPSETRTFSAIGHGIGCDRHAALLKDGRDYFKIEPIADSAYRRDDVNRGSHGWVELRCPTASGPRTGGGTITSILGLDSDRNDKGKRGWISSSKDGFKRRDEIPLSIRNGASI
jgi:hypothetical protein